MSAARDRDLYSHISTENNVKNTKDSFDDLVTLLLSPSYCLLILD